MKFILILLFSSLSMAGTVPGTCCHKSENAKRVMEEVGMSMDIAESELRIILNEPARGMKFPKEITAYKTRMEAAIYLLHFEMQYPCTMAGKYGETDWPQYEEVKRLFKELKKKYDIFYRTKCD